MINKMYLSKLSSDSCWRQHLVPHPLSAAAWFHMDIVSPGPRSSGLRAGRGRGGRGGRGDVPSRTCVSAEGARTRAAAGSSPASGRSWTSCLWCSVDGDKQTQDAG